MTSEIEFQMTLDHSDQVKSGFVATFNYFMEDEQLISRQNNERFGQLLERTDEQTVLEFHPVM
mgnify:CR=1 FL=1